MQAENPSGSDLNALTLYMISCLIFVVSAMIEFAVVIFITRYSTLMKKNQMDSLTPSIVRNKNEQMKTKTSPSCWKGNECTENVTENEVHGKNFPSSEERWLGYVASDINTIDLAAFCVYLLLFVLFNCIYWPSYLKQGVVDN